MERPQYLIDTNAVIDYLGRKLPLNGMKFMDSVIDATPNVSVITKIEVLGFNTHEEYYSLLTGFMDDSIIFDLSEESINQSILLRKKFKIKLPDVIIAATAISNKLQLITRNVKDFERIGLTTINPWEF